MPSEVRGASSASALGPWIASSATSSDTSLSRTLAPPLRSTMCSQSAARLAALTTSIRRSSKRYTRQSSTNVPRSVRIAEYCAWPGLSAPTSLQVTRCTKALRSGPETSNSPMWETSKIPTLSRTARCSAPMPPGYVTGISNPANGTILAPSDTCTACRGVCFRVSVMSTHECGQQGLLNVQAILGFVEDARLFPFDHVVRHLFPAVRWETVEEDGLGVGEPHQVGVHGVALERVAPRLRLGLLPHRGPYVGIHHVRPFHRFLGHLGDLHLRVLAGPLELGAVGLEPLGAGQAQLEAQHGGRLQPAVRHVVAVADPSDALVLPAAQRLAHREQVGEHLAGVRQVGESVDDRDGGPARQLFDLFMIEGADHDAVHVARQDARSVRDGLPAPQLDVLGRQEQRVAPQLGGPHLEGDPGAGAGIGEPPG